MLCSGVTTRAQLLWPLSYHLLRAPQTVASKSTGSPKALTRRSELRAGPSAMPEHSAGNVCHLSPDKGSAAVHDCQITCIVAWKTGLASGCFCHQPR